MFSNIWDVCGFIWIASLASCMTIFFVMLHDGKEYIAESNVSRNGKGMLNDMAYKFIFNSFCPVVNTLMLLGIALDFENKKEKFFERIDEAWGIVEDFDRNSTGV